MEGHQLDSESDIRNKQKKRHIRKRSCNRVLTDTITNELKRLSDLSDCSSTAHFKFENYYPTKNIADVCINNFRNCLSVHENPGKIIVYVPKAKNNTVNDFLYNMLLSNQTDFFHVCSTSVGNYNKNALMLPQHIRPQRDSMMKYRDEWCSCSGIDITRLCIFAKIMYEMLQLQNLTSKSQEPEDARDCVTSTILVDMANLRKLLNPLPGYDGVIKLYQSNPKQDIGYTKFERKKSIKYSISIEKHCMRFNIATCKINVFSRDFLQALETFFSMSNTGQNFEANCNVPSLSVRNWYIHNIIQGYFLGILLRNINVNTFNTMRNLYFVIITYSASILMIEIVIKLKSGIFMVYDNNFNEEVFNWKDPRQLFIKKSISLTTLENALQKRYTHMHNRERQLSVIAHIKTKFQKSNINIRRRRDYFINENDGTICTDAYYSDSESLLTSDMSAIVLAAESNRTLKTGDGALINNIFVDNSNMYRSNFLHSKQWLTKLVSNNNNYTAPTEKMQKRNIIDIFKFNPLNESIFDKTSLQRKLESVTDLYWKHITSQSFYMVFLKSLGQSMANIFFSAVI